MPREPDSSGDGDHLDNSPPTVVLPTGFTENDVTSGYGLRTDPFTGKSKPHNGVDFAAPIGTPVYAVGKGKVIHADHMGLTSAGKFVAIRHGDGHKTRYLHLSRVEVERGEMVKPGDKIGEVGSTGRSSGPHLHYEVIDAMGEHRDPLTHKWSP